MLTVQFLSLGEVPDEQLTYAVIASRFNGMWVWVRHRERHTWEIPGGRREAGEPIAETAARELREETGALKFALTPIAIYSVCREDKISYGQLYFANIQSLGDLPPSEIAEIKLFSSIPAELTYPLIQPHLSAKVEATIPQI